MPYPSQPRQSRSSRLHPGGWLVLLALLCQTLTLFYGARHFAAQLAESDGILEICTPAGMIRVSTTTGEEVGRSPADTLSVKACPYCGVTHPGILPSAPSPIYSLAARTVPPPLPRQPAPPRQPEQRHAPPRGPPLA